MIEALTEILTSELAMIVMAQIVIAIWALPRIQQWRERIRQSRYGEIWDVVVEAVQETYREYVRPAKLANDGSLKNKQRENARQKALEKVMDKLTERAPKLLGELSEETIVSLIEDAVAEEKGKGQR